MPERRVAFLLYEFPSPTQTFVVDQLENLLARGTDVLVFVRRRPYTIATAAPLHAVYDRIEWRRRTIDLGDESEWSRGAQSMRLVGRAVRALARSPVETLRLLQRVRAQPGPLRRRLATLLHALPFAGRGIDLLHVHFTWSGWEWERLAQALGVPLVVSVYGADVSLADADAADRNRALFAHADAILCSSRYLEQLTLAQGAPAERTRVLHPAIDCNFFSPDATAHVADPPVVLSVARLHWKKAHADGVRVIQRLRATGATFRWRIVGSGPEEASLRALVRANGIGDRVEFTGTLERSAVRDAMRSATLFFLPSLHEEFGVAAAEAQACGLPVVATRVGGIPEVVEDGESGMLLAAGDVDAMARALGTLLADPALRAEMGANGRARVRSRFGSEVTSGALPALYAGLDSGASGAGTRSLASTH